MCIEGVAILFLELEGALEPDAMIVVTISLEYGPWAGIKVFLGYEAGIGMRGIPSFKSKGENRSDEIT